MYEIKPYRRIGATSWAVFKNGYALYTGLTREQAEELKNKLEKREKENETSRV